MENLMDLLIYLRISKFKNKAFDENGLEVEVKVNGKKQSLKYKL